MDFPLKISFLLFLLSAANGQHKTGSSEDSQEKPRQLHTNQNNKTTEFPESEMKELFSGLLESLSQKLKEGNLQTLSKFENLNERMLKMERNKQELFSNLSRTLYENLEKFNRTLSDSFNEGLSKSDLKTETSLFSLSQTLAQKLSTTEFKMKKSVANLSGLLSGELRRWDSKLETSLRNLSESLGGRLPSSESQETGERGTPNQTTERNEQQRPSATPPLTTLSTVEGLTEIIPEVQLPTQTEVVEVSEINGTIEFRGESNLNIRRKIWVLWAERSDFRFYIHFVMEENNLGENAHLSLWDSVNGENVHVWNGLQTDWRKERTATGYLVLLTLSVNHSANPGPPPSFKITFTSRNESTGYEHSSEIMRKDGVQSLSFPHQNAQNYSPRSYFQAVIAPQSGRPFSLTLKYLDVPGTPPECSGSGFFVAFLEESSTETNYKTWDQNKFSQCGRLGNVSQFLGTSTVAIVRFRSLSPSNTGTGFRMEMKTN